MSQMNSHKIIKKRVLINAVGGSYWIGGIYYKKNIIFSALKSEKIRSQCEFLIATERVNFDLFKEFENECMLIEVHARNRVLLKLELAYLYWRFNCSLFFPMVREFYLKGVFWIPDFQHKRMPWNFSEKDKKKKDRDFNDIVRKSFPLILSSCDALNDFHEFYGFSKKNVYVVPFVSYIERNLREITMDYVDIVMKKYRLPDAYVCVMNQFWKHKNHMIVFDAIEELEKNREKVTFVMTGKLEDNRDVNYIAEIRNLISAKRNYCEVIYIGFTDRNEQLAIMKNSLLVIQPSLFEGWGTVLEDAKVLDKLVLLSDIRVHREQMNGNCVLFDPYNKTELSQKILNCMNIDHVDDIEEGVKRMHEDATRYAAELERVFC